MDRRSKAVLSLSVVMVLALLVPAGALAKGRPTIEATNNLSVPTIMLAGGSFTNVVCGADAFSALVPPTGTPLTGYPTNPLRLLLRPGRAQVAGPVQQLDRHRPVGLRPVGATTSPATPS